MAIDDKAKNPSSTLRLVLRRVAYAALVVSPWLLFLRLLFSSPAPNSSFSSSSSAGGRRAVEACDPDIAPFYVYDLPRRFNDDLLQRCRSLVGRPGDMCPMHVANRGLGQPPFRLSDLADSSEDTSWYATHQLAAEMLFHARAERHPCRTADPDDAFMFYIPFYAGLYASGELRQLDGGHRQDALAADLAAAISSRHSFLRQSGRDHFLVVGRAAAPEGLSSDSLLRTPELANVTVLSVDVEHHIRNQFGIPYPSFFHPRAASEVSDWQAELRSSERSHLFAVVGAPENRVNVTRAQSEILKQCRESDRCLYVACKSGSPTCRDPNKVLGALQRAVFCVQFPGDSFEQTFDAVLAGCVPVFFFFPEHGARPAAYEWYLPERFEDWSVQIEPDGWGRIEEELDRVPKARVDRMREVAVQMIPRVTYAHPDSTRFELGFRDAVDVALVELTKLVMSSMEKE